jgi:SAM-dependent methyltransferase
MPPETFRDLMRLVHGFESAKIVLVANDIGLFQKLGVGRAVDQLAADLVVDARALRLLLNALVALGLLVKDGETYSNAPVADQFLAGDGYRGHIFKHIHHCWDSWNDLAGVLERGGPDRVREASILHDEVAWNQDFIRGMDDVTRDLAPQVVAKLDLAGARSLLDVGGGPGTYARAFLSAHTSLEQVTIFDLPLTLNVARDCLAGDAHQSEIRLLEGDFTRDGFEAGYDAVWISQVFHSQDENGCRMLIEKAWQALNPGGRLMIHEFLLDDDQCSPLAAALFSVHMLVMTDGGRGYSGGELSAWMEQQGFVAPRIEKVSEETAVVSAMKP